MKYDIRICKILGRIINEIGPSSDGDGTKFHVPTIVNDMTANSRVEKFIKLFGIESVIFGEYGEIGMAAFLDKNLSEIVRVCFEQDDDGSHCFILDEKDMENLEE